MSEKKMQQTIIDALKRDFMKASWWEEVQEDVKTRINWLTDHVAELGPLFAKSYMSLFRWEFERRKLGGENVTSPMASYLSSLLGMRISEEAYQCGLLPTRAVLNLYDFVRPNDADVAMCLMFCHKVEALQKTGILDSSEKELKTSPSEMAKLLRPVKKQIKPIQEETLLWDDEDPINN